MADKLVFLHLSDIHFRCWSGSQYDIDVDLRNELLLDAVDMVKQLSKPSGILVCGDIAFSGTAEEYIIAKDWLTKLSEGIGGTLADIWCVPGNHDVDRECIKRSPLLPDIHKGLRESDLQNLDAKIRSYMKDATAGGLVFQPINEYNRFAGSFRCQLTAEVPTWHRDFPLNDGSTLRIHGLNSTIVSDHTDDLHKRVLLGQFQVPQREPGFVHVVMCHHPPDWWGDRDPVEQHVDERARIELFGHKHVQRLVQIDNTLRITAGAVHPDRRETNWRPRYNWLVVRVSRPEDKRRLEIDVYPRVWSESQPKFIADRNTCNGQDHRHFSLLLEEWEPAFTNAPPGDTVQGCDSIGGISSVTPGATAKTESGTMDFARILTYRFFDLAHVVRIDIARELRLLKDEDEGLQDFELFDRVFQRADEGNLLAQLWDKVEERHVDGKYPVNPFRTNVSSGG